jgi:hypothetical protein
MTRIGEEDYTFVTNDRTDFAALYGKEELHAGLVIIVPNVIPARQRKLFRAALSHIGQRDLINAMLEVDLRCYGYLPGIPTPAVNLFFRRIVQPRPPDLLRPHDESLRC